MAKADGNNVADDVLDHLLPLRRVTRLRNILGADIGVVRLGAAVVGGIVDGRILGLEQAVLLVRAVVNIVRALLPLRTCRRAAGHGEVCG